MSLYEGDEGLYNCNLGSRLPVDGHGNADHRPASRASWVFVQIAFLSIFGQVYIQAQQWKTEINGHLYRSRFRTHLHLQTTEKSSVMLKI
jgi:hypothetical protein